MERLKLETYPQFDPLEIQELYDFRGWKTELVKVSNVELVSVDQGAAIECADGRSNKFHGKKFHGVRFFGQINGVAALKTGGNIMGFYSAAQYLIEQKIAPGTHGAINKGEGCGMFGLWKDKKYQYSDLKDFCLPLEILERYNISPTRWIKAQMKMLGGKHFTLPDSHQEQALRLNPFVGTTEKASSGDRFIVDDWFMPELSYVKKNNFNAETVERLKPDAKKVEILIP